MRAWIGPVASVLALAACDAAEPAGGRPRAASTPALATSRPSATETAGAADPAGGGPAYVATVGGLCIVSAGKVTTARGISAGVTELMLASDGTLYAATPTLYRVEQGIAKKTAIVSSLATVAPDGAIWIPGDDRSVRVFERGAMRTLPLPATPRCVAITARGEVFAASHDAVYHREGSTWPKVELSPWLGDKPRLRGFAAGPKGELYAVTAKAIARRSADGTWSQVVLPGGIGVFDYGPVSSTGELPIVTSAGVMVVSPFEQATLTYETMKVGPSAVSAVAVDGRGRRWIGTDAGLLVVSPSGQILQRWQPGALPGRAVALVVRGAGPSLPPQPPAPVIGGLKARLVMGDRPLADAEVELCAVPALVASQHDTPCARSAVRFATQTDAEGAFLAARIPRQSYRLAVKEAGRWRLVLAWGDGKDCCAQLEPGLTVDMGDVIIR